MPKDRSIYIAYRGSESFDNWITDLSTLKTRYNDPNCVDCEVHSGFFEAEQNVITGIYDEVRRVSQLYGTRSVKTTGHSLGAALANLTAMDMVRAGYDVSLYNFGQPRVGNKKYADYCQKMLPEQYRHVHNKDMVPHTPPEDLFFKHSATEIFEDVDGNLKVCSATDGEDKSCSDQFWSFQYGPSDHRSYLGMCMG